MDIGTLRGLGTAIIFIAFVVLLIWVFGRSKKSFDEAANLPFADEPKSEKREEEASRSKHE
ncbi:cytochrome c oxidase cbb3-type subunit 4 [Geopseudomonas sagittaria]|jgi:cytochrome c oxidase cbb3-type subunit 4|uniref:Cytochrome c oxidase cbb3-type subunit 4 n=1 Tax=Geopseudomonas sagittaria TaxID=1135990 RepID=A0A1I5YEH7_9GAMM|nr:cbb3-type cytochrome c oxidase subunit 3 [Pseudomonas sagittaria]MCM2330675.1 cbb3-type cytochrome c oxidase subunit 3 [Pseudomonas sagittaria]SFQ42621.1 cytochrome c oxidase cbb3-type subunit 4 [Pseudomonas sagittaria]